MTSAIDCLRHIHSSSAEWGSSGLRHQVSRWSMSAIEFFFCIWMHHRRHCFVERCYSSHQSLTHLMRFLMSHLLCRSIICFLVVMMLLKYSKQYLQCLKSSLYFVLMAERQKDHGDLLIAWSWLAQDQLKSLISHFYHRASFLTAFAPVIAHVSSCSVH